MNDTPTGRPDSHPGGRLRPDSPGVIRNVEGRINMTSNSDQVADQAVQAEAVQAGGRKVQNILTAIVAGIATVASATGMWRYFGDVLEIKDPLGRAGVFAVFELALLISALRARRYRLQHGRSGVDDVAVWVLAVITGVLAATDTTSWKAALGRLVLPLVAAFLFERAISAERSDRVKRRRVIHWRNPLERVAVRLGLASAREETVEQVDRARRLAKLARIAYRAQTAKVGRGLAQWRLRRRLAEANESLGLVTDRTAVRDLQAGVALLFEAIDQTTREAVVVASPWRATDLEEADPAEDQIMGQGGQVAVQAGTASVQGDQDQVDPSGQDQAVQAVRVNGHGPAEFQTAWLAGHQADRVNGHSVQAHPEAAAPSSSATTVDLAGGRPNVETREAETAPLAGPKTDESLLHQYGDQLRDLRVKGQLSRYRVEKLLNCQKRQADRIIDAIAGDVDLAGSER